MNKAVIITFLISITFNSLSQKNAKILYYISPQEIGLDSAFINNEIDSIANLGIKDGAFPGCQVLAAKDGKVFFHKAYGYHTYDSITPVSEENLYDFASITKITAPLPALMKLYDEGKIDLDTSFSVYWDGFKKNGKDSLSLREILAHQAQLKPWIPFWKKSVKKNGRFKRRYIRKDSSKKYSIKVCDYVFLNRKFKNYIYRTINKSELSPKKKYKYSGLAFFLFPQIIENLSGSEYKTYLNDSFYKVIGANSITFTPLRYHKKKNIIPTEKDTIFRGSLLQGFVHDEGAALLNGYSGNAGLFGTTLDLAKIMQLYLNKGKFNNKQIIKASTIEEFTKCQYPKNENRRGLGFDKPLLENRENGSCAFNASYESFGHSGYTGTFTWADPENGLLFVFMSNRVYPTRNNSKIYKLNIRPSMHQVFYEVINMSKEKNESNKNNE